MKTQRKECAQYVEVLAELRPQDNIESMLAHAGFVYLTRWGQVKLILETIKTFFW